jgi:hypothetical protein
MAECRSRGEEAQEGDARVINTSTQAGLPERALIGLIVYLSAHIGEIRSGVDERIGLLATVEAWIVTGLDVVFFEGYRQFFDKWRSEESSRPELCCFRRLSVEIPDIRRFQSISRQTLSNHDSFPPPARRRNWKNMAARSNAQ